MAESSQQPERNGGGHRARPRDKKSHQVPVHRVNDFLVGHIGQVSYDPHDDDDQDADVGHLHFTRACEQPPTIQQCAPIELWLPPTRTAVALPSSTTFQRNQSQKHWLLKTHPEAFLGNLNLPRLLSHESASNDASEPAGCTRSILAVGGIHNKRDARSSRTTPWPVVAMAAGQGGHVLQVSSIRPVKWDWSQSSFPVGGLEAKFSGSWRGDGAPITQIQFATKPKQFDPLRWLVVQKETSTVIFEPELRAKPVKRQASQLELQTGTVEHIALNPIVTLTSASTNSQTHCDFSINLGSEEEAPQLAIVDNSGTWSIWYLEREGVGKHKKTRAVLRRTGSWDPPLSTRPWGVGDSSRKAYSVAWIDRLKSMDDWVHDESSVGGTDHASAGGLCNAFLSGLESSGDRHNGLIVCNSTHLQALSAADDNLTAWLDFSRRDRADTLLSIQAYPGSHGHLLALTTDAVHLLDVGVADEHKKRPPSILVSCRHYRNARRECLKMAVTRLHPVGGDAASLVVLYSTQNCRLDLFSFTISRDYGDAQFSHQGLQLPPLDEKNRRNNRGIESLLAIPLQLRPDRKHGTIDDIKPSATQFFQIFGLTTELSLVSTVVSHSKGALEALPVMTKSLHAGWSEGRRSRFLRRQMLRQHEQAFVVADADDRDHQLSLVQQPQETAATKAETVQLRYYLGRLMEEINRAFFGEADRDDMTDDTDGPFWPIHLAAQDLEESTHVSLRPVLGFSKWWQPLSLSKDEDQWELDLVQLRKNQAVELFECGKEYSRLGIMDLFEKFSISWSARLPADGLRAMQWRYMEHALERMAAEVYLSARGAYVAPQATRELAAKAALPAKEALDDNVGFDERGSSQPVSHRAFSTPRTTPSNSRATSEAVDDDGPRSQTEEDPGFEDPAVARLRMYLSSIKFTPPPRNGPSRVVSFWPEQRGVDPAEYEYRPPGKSADAQVQAAKRRREKEEARRKRRAERKAQLGIKMEGIAESMSQQLIPPAPAAAARSSPPAPDVRSSQNLHSQGSGFGFGGFSQTMSQPLPGEFGNRQAKLKKAKVVKKMKGFK